MVAAIGNELQTDFGAKARAEQRGKAIKLVLRHGSSLDGIYEGYPLLLGFFTQLEIALEEVVPHRCVGAEDYQAFGSYPLVKSPAKEGERSVMGAVGELIARRAVPVFRPGNPAEKGDQGLHQLPLFWRSRGIG